MGKESKLERIVKLQEVLNTKLADVLKENGITNLRLTSVGNSIASGYSMVRTVKPLLLRNESIDKILSNFNIMLARYIFARAQNNNDEHVNEWLGNNTNMSEINALNRNDLSSDSKIHMQTTDLKQEEIDEYFPKEVKEDKGMQDVILESNENLANIVIYSGATGSFLDNVTRNGPISHKFTYGIKRDISSIEATLKYIQNSNRNNNTNTQVYLCGAPNYLGLNITGIINNKLKKLASEYANVVYVNPVKAKLFYKKYGLDDNSSIKSFQDFIKQIKFPSIDIHYDEIEYLEFNNNIIDSISNNYETTKALINVDRNLYKFSAFVEHDQSIIGDKDKINEMVSGIISSEYSDIKDKDKKNQFLLRAKKYLLNRLPYDFHYAGKENIEQGISKVSR